MSKSLLGNFDAAYFIKFLIIFLVQYYFHLFFYGITTPAGTFYSSFLEYDLNYIAWLRSFILHTSDIITHVFGFPTHIADELTIRVYDRPGVTLNYACLGFGIVSFWIAFVVAHSGNWQKKLYWCTIGIVAICFINCIRVSLLLISMEKDWSGFDYIDHHDMFNLGSYVIILFLIYLFDKAGNKEQGNATKNLFVDKANHLSESGGSLL